MSPDYSSGDGGFDAAPLRALIAGHEEWLMQRILDYALRQGYTRYTSTLAEAWRASIQGLSGSLDEMLAGLSDPAQMELDPEQDYSRDPAAAFGVLEARRHRSRGITLGLFLGLMKYYRRTYLDLVEEQGLGGTSLALVERFFDRVELGFCSEWATHGEDDKLAELQVANRMITNEKNKFLTIFESLDLPALFLDSDGRLRHLNHAAAHLFAGADVPGAGYYARQPEALELSWPKEEDLATLAEGREDERWWEQDLPTHAGLRRFEVRVRPMLDVSQKFAGTVVTCKDITQRTATARALQRSEREVRRLLDKARGDLEATTDVLAGIIEGTPDLIAAVDSKLRFIAFNIAYRREFQALFGGRVGVGMSLSEAFAGNPEQGRRARPLWQRALGGDAFTVTRKMTGADGGERYFDVSYSPIRDEDGQVMGAACILRDVSDRKEREIALRRTLDALTRSNYELERFAQLTSHDLQEPLNSVTRYTQLLARRLEGRLDDEESEYITFVIGETQRMRDLVKGLMTYSRIGDHGHAFQAVEAGQLLAEAHSSLEAEIQAFGAELTNEALPRVLGDEAQLSELFRQVLSNSLKFSDPDRPPRIHVAAEVDGDRALFRIQDNGIGIEAAYLERVFDVFERLHPPHAYPGTGIGLAICRRVVERHNGRIWAESSPDVGTVIQFTLPLAEPDGAA